MENITINWNSNYIPELCVYKYVDIRKNEVIYVDIAGDIVRSIYYNAYKKPFKKYMPYIEVYSYNCVDIQEAEVIRRFLINEYKPILNEQLTPAENTTISIGSAIEWTYRFKLDLEPLYQDVPISTIRDILKNYEALRKMLRKYNESDIIYISGKTESSVIDEFVELYAMLKGARYYEFSEKKHFVDAAERIFNGPVLLEKVSRYQDDYRICINFDDIEQWYYQLDNFKDKYPQIKSQLKKIIKDKGKYKASSMTLREINDGIAYQKDEKIRKECIELYKEASKYNSKVFVD